MNFDISSRYFASFGWSLTRTAAHDNAPVILLDAESASFGKFDSVRSAMTSWMALIHVAYAHKHSVETAIRLAARGEPQRAAILDWARSGGVSTLPRDLDLAINLRVAKIKGDYAAALAQGKRLAPLIARENTDLAADVFARLCEQDRQTLDGTTRDVLGDGALPLRL